MTGSHIATSPITCGRKRSTRVGLKWRWLVGLVFLILSFPASAQLVEVPDTWGGHILTRPRLTGDWGGLRDELEKGDRIRCRSADDPASRHQRRPQLLAEISGNLDYTINVDTQKLGLWPGGFFKFSADTGFGSNAFGDAGAIVPVNTAALLPAPDDRTTALTNATLTQFLSPKLGLTTGKFNLLDSGATEFYGDYRTQFLNAAFNFPMTLALIPLSTFGGGVIVLPRDDLLLSALALGPNGTPTSNASTTMSISPTLRRSTPRRRRPTWCRWGVRCRATFTTTRRPRPGWAAG